MTLRFIQTLALPPHQEAAVVVPDITGYQPPSQPRKTAFLLKAIMASGPILVKAAPFPEDVFVSSWWRQTNEPRRPLKGLPARFQKELFFVKVDPFTDAPNFGYFRPPSQPTYRKPMPKYWQTFVLPIDYAMGWFRALSEPVRRKVRAMRPWTFEVYIEATRMDWFYPPYEPYTIKRHIPEYPQIAFVADIPSFLPSWYPIYPQPRIPPRALQTRYQLATFIDVVHPAEMGWYVRLSEPSPYRKGLKPPYQQFLAFYPRPIRPVPPPVVARTQARYVRDAWDKDSWGRFIPGSNIRRVR